MELSAVDRVKTAAEKWGASITTITGVFGIITLIKGPEDISNLTSGNKMVVGIALLVALVTAVTSIFLAALAAQGIPHDIWLTGAQARRDSRNVVKKASAFLAVSRFLVIPAVLGMGAAIGLTWYGDRVAEKAASVGGELGTLCGELSRDEEGHLVFRSKEEYP